MKKNDEVCIPVKDLEIKEGGRVIYKADNAEFKLTPFKKSENVFETIENNSKDNLEVLYIEPEALEEMEKDYEKYEARLKELDEEEKDDWMLVEDD